MTLQVAHRTNLSKSVVIMAGVYSSNFDCEIKLNDRGRASTNGRVIHIPKPKPEYLDLTWGYCAHEAGHVRFTNNPLISETKMRDFSLGWLLNVIEDTRIEKLMVSAFPGVKKYFKSLSESVLKYGGMEEGGEQERLLSSYLFYYIRGKLTGYPIWDEKVIELEQYLLRTTNIFFMMQLQEEMQKVDHLTSTEQALELAEVLHEVIRKAPEPEDDDDQGDDQDSGQGDDQDGSQGDDQDSGQGDDQDSGQGDDQDGDQGDDQDGSQGDDQDGSQGDDQDSGQGDDQDGSQGDQLGSIVRAFLDATADDLREGDLGKELEAILNDDSAKEAMTAEELAGLIESPLRNVSVSSATVADFESFARHTTMNLRQGLIRLLEDQVRTQRQTVRRGRRVSRSKVNRLLTGNTRIFKRKFSEREGVNCDVAVLADSSGSMGHDIEHVKVATYALLDCIDKIEGAQSSAISFESCNVQILQAHGEGFSSKVKGRIASMNCGGGTPTAEALWAATKSLIQMPAPKKVVVVVTDGEPDDVKTTKNIVLDLQANGIQVVCIGVGVPRRAVPQLDFVYGKQEWMHVKDFRDLPSELLRVAKNII